VRTPPDGHKFHMAAQPEPTQSEPTRGKATLAEPTPHVHASFVEAVREYRAEGRYSRLDPVQLANPDQFRRYLDRLRADARLSVLRHASRRPTCGWSRARITWVGCRYGTG